MARGPCCRINHPKNCSCAMLSLYRFVEPLALYLLKKNGPAHGYDLLLHIREHVLTGTPIDGPALYRALRILEKNGYLTSIWETGGPGPAKRQYSLTPSGDEHLLEWRDVLARLDTSVNRFVAEIDEVVHL